MLLLMLPPLLLPLLRVLLPEAGKGGTAMFSRPGDTGDEVVVHVANTSGDGSSTRETEASTCKGQVNNNRMRGFKNRMGSCERRTTAHI
jgi:hypothetical protein